MELEKLKPVLSELRPVLDKYGSEAVQEAVYLYDAIIVLRNSGVPRKRKLREKSAKHYPPHCLRCNEPHKGPRFSFMCEKHLNTPKPQKAKLLAAWHKKK